MSGERAAGPILAFIDAIEEGKARLLIMNSKASGADSAFQAQVFPAALLPQGAGEGSWIELRIQTVPPPADQDPSELRRRLGKKDGGGDIVL